MIQKLNTKIKLVKKIVIFYNHFLLFLNLLVSYFLDTDHAFFCAPVTYFTPFKNFFPLLSFFHRGLVLLFFFFIFIAILFLKRQSDSIFRMRSNFCTSYYKKKSKIFNSKLHFAHESTV